MKKKLFALLLAVVMLTGLLAACGDKKTTESTGTTNNGGGNTPSGSDAKDFTYIDNYVKGLASGHTYDGATFSIIGRGLTEDENGYSRNGGFPMVEELTNVRESDALYYRQRDLENTFNIDIVTQNVDRGDYDGPGTPTALQVIDSTSAGLHAYDLVEGNLSTCGRLLLEKGALSAADALDGIDFSQNWWLNDIDAQLSLAGRQFFLVGKISTQHYGDPTCILFNKRVANDYGISEPYEFVKSGEWTFDKMNEMSQSIPAGGDVYRNMIRWSCGLAYYIGAGYSISEKNAEGIPEVPSALTGDQTDYINKLATVFGDTSITYNLRLPSQFGASTWSDMTKMEDMFTGNKALFWTTSMERVAEMRQYDVEFGILPIPMADASQDKYISYADSGIVSGFFVPSDVKNPEMVGYVAEAMAALSEKYLEPAYYDSALMQRGVYDLDSKDMLDIIYKTKKLDLADIYGFGSGGDSTVATAIDNNAVGYKEDLSASYSVNARMAKRSVKNLLDIIKQYD